MNEFLTKFPEYLKLFISWLWDNKQYTLTATLTFCFDLYFKWHAVVFDYIKSKLLKHGSEKSNYTLYTEGLLRQRQQILQEPLYIWEYSNYENTSQLYKKGYVSKLPINTLGNTHRRLLILQRNKGIAILGKAGSGKSTYLRRLFLTYSSRFHRLINNILNRRFYFYKATELLKNTEILSYLENDQRYSKGRFVFLDGLDEVNDSDYKKLVQKIKRIYNFNYTILFSCRKEDYQHIKKIEPELFTFVTYHLEIGDWTEMQSNQYIDNYLKLYPNSKIRDMIAHCQTNDEYKEFLKTPLELSLLIYILEHIHDLSDFENRIKNRFSLYEKFLEFWIRREIIKRNDNIADIPVRVADVFNLWSTISFLLIKNSSSKYISINHPEIQKILHGNIRLGQYVDGIVVVDRENERQGITGFTHERIKEFLAAYYFYLHVANCDEYSIDALLWEYKHSVTVFIQEHFKLLTHNDLLNEFMNLSSILFSTEPYRRKPSFEKYRNHIESRLKKRIRQLSAEETRTLKNQIIYFVSRIPSIDTELLSIGNEVIEIVFESENDAYNKRSAAIGATILGNDGIELKYAKELLEDEECNLRDRSFTLVYYQDVKEKNPFTYIDDGICQWDNSRRYRLERLKDNSEKSIRLRTFDLITIYNFSRSRAAYFVPTPDDLDIIRHCEVNLSSYTKEKKELLNTVKDKLLHLWEQLIDS